MRFKEEFLKELVKRLKENIDIIESSFKYSNLTLVKTKLFNVEPLETHIPIIIEDDPYIFLSKIIYMIINRQPCKVSSSNLGCNLLLELINMILDEFVIERIDCIG